MSGFLTVIFLTLIFNKCIIDFLLEKKVPYYIPILLIYDVLVLLPWFAIACGAKLQ